MCIFFAFVISYNGAFSSQSIPNGVLAAADSSHNIAMDRGGSCPPSAAVTPATTPVGAALNNISEYTVTITSDEFIYAKVCCSYREVQTGNYEAGKLAYGSLIWKC